jgi:hypothetical protein
MVVADPLIARYRIRDGAVPENFGTAPYFVFG